MPQGGGQSDWQRRREWQRQQAAQRREAERRAKEQSKLAKEARLASQQQATENKTSDLDERVRVLDRLLVESLALPAVDLPAVEDLPGRT